MKSEHVDFLDGIDSLLNEIEVLDKDSLVSIKSDENPNETELLATVEQQIRKNISAIDSYVILKVSEDKMHLYISYYPARFGGKPLNKNMVVQALNEINITDHLGLKWNNIERGIKIVNSTENPITDEEISSGIPPINKIPSHIIFKKEIHTKKIVSDNHETIDFKTFSPFIIVDEGEEIAEVVKEVRGYEGFDVYDRKIPFSTQKIESWTPGKNVEIKDNLLISTINGSLKTENKIISVEKILLIPGNVDYGTGNIDFKGDVRIQGFIQDDFQVVSHGKLFCEDNVYGAFIRCSKTIEISGGILGKNKGKVACGGDLKVKFIENAFISCSKNMYIIKEIIHSNIYCSGYIKMGPKSIIIGSELFAQNGIETQQLGNRVETPVKILLGIDYIIQKKLEKTSKVQNKLAQKETSLSSQLNVETDENKKEEIETKLKTIIDYRKKVITVMTNLLNKLQQNDGAKLIVRGNIYPGVYIEICHVGYKVKDIMSNVEFFLNKKNGNIEFKKNK